MGHNDPPPASASGGYTITSGQWLTLAAALLGWLFDGFEMGIFPLVARPALIDVLGLKDDDQITRDLDRSKSERTAVKERVDGEFNLWMGRATAAFLFGAALGGWLFGWIGDRVGRVNAMAASVLTYAAFTGLCGFAQQAWHLAALRFLSALGMGGEWALGVALVMESWPRQTRPLLAGLIGAAGNAGYLLTIVPVKALEAAGSVMDAGGWRWCLGLCALPAVLTFLLRLFVPESEKWKHAVASGPRTRLVDIFTPALWRRSLLAAALGSVALVGTWGSVQWIPTWVKTITRDQDMANWAQTCSALGAILGCLLGALVGVRLSRRVVYFALCLGSLLICAWLFRWLPAAQNGASKETVDGLFFAAVFLAGALTASFYGWLPLYLPELFPTRVRATGQGFGFNSGRIIAAFGALFTGYLTKEVFKGDFAAAGATISLVYVVGLIVIWAAPETRGQPLPE
jgi:MFS family permease